MPSVQTSTPATRPDLDRDSRCTHCQRLLMKSAPGQEVSAWPQASTVHVVKCKHCKTFNYLGPSSTGSG